MPKVHKMQNNVVNCLSKKPEIIFWKPALLEDKAIFC